MSGARSDVARWREAGAIPPARVREALLLVEGTPSHAAWRQFLERVLLWAGLVALSAALGFFIAANWQALGRFGKLALVESVIVAMLALALWRGFESAWGRACLFVASLAVGTLFALIGQTYQTGADTWELFAVWAVAILPWVLVARQTALWILWVAIVDVAAWLHTGSALSWFSTVFGERRALWMILAIHVIALAAWEIGIARGIRWLDVRWPRRLLALGAGIAATVLVVEAVLDGRIAAPETAAYLALLSGLYVMYRVRTIDLFVLAAAVLSAIVVIVSCLVRAGTLHGPFEFLAIGLVIAALAAAGARWLRSVAGKV